MTHFPSYSHSTFYGSLTTCPVALIEDSVLSDKNTWGGHFFFWLLMWWPLSLLKALNLITGNIVDNFNIAKLSSLQESERRSLFTSISFMFLFIRSLSSSGALVFPVIVSSTDPAPCLISSSAPSSTSSTTSSTETSSSSALGALHLFQSHAYQCHAGGFHFSVHLFFLCPDLFLRMLHMSHYFSQVSRLPPNAGVLGAFPDVRAHILNQVGFQVGVICWVGCPSTLLWDARMFVKHHPQIHQLSKLSWKFLRSQCELGMWFSGFDRSFLLPLYSHWRIPSRLYLVWPWPFIYHPSFLLRQIRCALWKFFLTHLKLDCILCRSLRRTVPSLLPHWSLGPDALLPHLSQLRSSVVSHIRDHQYPSPWSRGGNLLSFSVVLCHHLLHLW